jgi:hypothetical protein
VKNPNLVHATIAAGLALFPVMSCFVGSSSTQDGGPTACAAETTVFAKKCGGSGCHDSTSPSGDLDLVTPGLAARAAGVPALGCGGKIELVPGNPSSSYIFEKISGTPTCGDRMPIGSPLSSSDIECVRAWIASLPPLDGGTSAGDGGSPDSGPACAAPQVSCGGKCVDTTVDKNNCGKCGTVCPVACSAGACVTTCPMPTMNCNGSCVNTQTDNANCGKCTNPCTGGKVCTAGTCACGASVMFASQVQPILSTCATVACHAGVMPKGSLDLSSGKSYAALVGKPSSACSNRIRVIAGDPPNSYLMSKLLGTNMCSGTQMPKIGSSLPQAQLDLVRGWICNGAPNN